MEMELVFNNLSNESKQDVLCTLTGKIYDYNNAPNHSYDPDVLDDYFKSHNEFWASTWPANGYDVDYWYPDLPMDKVAGRVYNLSCVNGILSGTFDLINTPAGRSVAESFDITQLMLYPCAEGDVDSTGKVISYDLSYFIVKAKHTGV